MAEGSRLDLSFHQTGWIHVLFSELLVSRFIRLLNTTLKQLLDRPNGLGGESGVAPPVPMPNTVVKRSSADDTRVIKPWENRPVPGPFGRSRSWSHTTAISYTDRHSTRGGAVVARRAHNPKVSGSNPLPATNH